LMNWENGGVGGIYMEVGWFFAGSLSNIYALPIHLPINKQSLQPLSF
jgi:hypothetical protein